MLVSCMPTQEDNFVEDKGSQEENSLEGQKCADLTVDTPYGALTKPLDNVSGSNRVSTIFRAVKPTVWFNSLKPQERDYLGKLEEWYCMTHKSPVHNLGVDHGQSQTTSCDILLVEPETKKRAPKLNHDVPGTYINTLKGIDRELKAIRREQHEKALKAKRQKRLLEALPVGEVIVNLELIKQ